MSIRLIDVARAAGVSRSTASNVFNAPDMVRPALREKVTAAARELGYAGPDARGRLLRAGKFNTIAVMAPTDWGAADALRNPVFNQFLQGVAEACDMAGANVLLVPNGTSRKVIGTALADGFIFGRIEHMQQIEAAKLRQSPFCVVDFDPGPGISAVKVDARAGAYQAARHLLDLGHRRFAVMSFLREAGAARFFAPGTPRRAEAYGIPTDQDKFAGYADALAEASLDIAQVPMVQADPWDASAAPMLLERAPEATAILSMSAMQGLAVMAEARRRGLSVPQDLSIVGFNDIAEAATTAPGLTTVDGMSQEKGRLAAGQVIEGGEPQHILLQPKLIIRGSSGPAHGRQNRQNNS